MNNDHKKHPKMKFYARQKDLIYSPRDLAQRPTPTTQQS